MALTPGSPYVPNPYLPFCWLKIGGVEVTTFSGGRPRSLTGFNYNRTSETEANIFAISLFDDNWEYIEGLIVSSKGEDIEFQYGYTQGLKSPVYQGKLLDYTPIFTIDGVKITMQGYSRSIKNDERVKSKTFVDKDIHEIVQEIADENGWNAEIDETITIYDNHDLNKAGLVKAHFIQEKMTDMQFIKNILIPRAVRKKDKVADYRAYFEDDRNLLHFHPSQFDKPEVRTFRFMRDKMSEILSFSPQVTGNLNIRRGAGVAAAPFIDWQTGEYKDVRHNDSTTPEKILLGGPVTRTEGFLKEYYNVVEHRPIRDEDQADIAARDRYYEWFNKIFGAEMVILGDPRIKQGDIIRIIVIQPNGRLHYTSGLYRVNEVLDVIQNGQFTTTIKLLRTGFTVTESIRGDIGTGIVKP